MKIIFLVFEVSLTAGIGVTSATADADPAAIHGMLMVGNRTVYLSHLPMFHSPHDYQIILQVNLPPQVQAAYVNDRFKTHQRIYTLVPDQAFNLPTEVMEKKPFTATIFRGHFERGGVAILKNVVVNIQKVVYFHKFNPADHPLPQLEYFLFGNPPELFMAHLIVVCPDYDQVIAVATAHPVPPLRLASPILMSFPGRSDATPLKEGEETQAQIGPGPQSQGLTQVQTETIKVLGQFYFETGDLVCMTH